MNFVSVLYLAAALFFYFSANSAYRKKDYASVVSGAVLSLGCFIVYAAYIVANK